MPKEREKLPGRYLPMYSTILVNHLYVPYLWPPSSYYEGSSFWRPVGKKRILCRDSCVAIHGNRRHKQVLKLTVTLTPEYAW
jgi:hypothetical protein